jgi:eukaryotic-like serine/threonine-protein kinase
MRDVDGKTGRRPRRRDARKRAGTRHRWALVAALALAVAVSADLPTMSPSAAARQEAEEQVILDKDVPLLADPLAPGARHIDSAAEALATRELASIPATTQPLARAALLLQSAEAYFSLSQYAKAQALQGKAVGLLEQACGPAAEATLEAEYLQARSLYMLSHFPEAGVLLDHADSQAGGRLQAMTRLAMIAKWSRGGFDLLRSRPQQALRLYEESERIREKILADDTFWRFRIKASIAIAYVHLDRSQDEVALLEQLARSDYAPDQVSELDWIKTRLAYGLALGNVGRPAEAGQVMQAAVKDTERLLGRRNYLTGVAWNFLGSLYEAGGHWDEALKAQSTAHAIMEDTVGPMAMGTVVTAASVAILEYRTGDLNHAVADLRVAHEAIARVLEKDVPQAQIIDFYFASALNDSGQTEEASSLAQGLRPEVLAMAEAGGHWNARLDGLRGLILVREGRTQQGEAMVRAALTTLRREHAPPWMLTRGPGA